MKSSSFCHRSNFVPSPAFWVIALRSCDPWVISLAPLVIAPRWCRYHLRWRRNICCKPTQVMTVSESRNHLPKVKVANAKGTNWNISCKPAKSREIWSELRLESSRLDDALIHFIVFNSPHDPISTVLLFFEDKYDNKPKRLPQSSGKNEFSNCFPISEKNIKLSRRTNILAIRP